MKDANGSWITVARRSALAPGRMLGASVAGDPVALFEVDGEIFATSDVCTHSYALLSHGWFAGRTVGCPFHGARYDVCTGRALSGPTEGDLKTFRVRVADGDVQIHFPAPDLPQRSTAKPNGR